MDDATPKTCSRCNRELMRADFNKRSRSRDGLSVWCKECTRENSKQWRVANEDRCRIVSAKYRDAHREERQRRGRDYYVQNRDRINAAARARYEDDPELRARLSVAHKAWFRDNADRAAETHARWMAANREFYLEIQRAWRRANPERSRQHSQRWRAANPELVELRRRLGAAIECGQVDLKELWTGYCGLCGEPLDRDLKHPDPLSKSVDHITPLSKGGTHEQANLQWAHLICNIRKGNRI